MAFLKIIKPGLLTTIQDRGRFYYQRWGVPVAGAMDEYALRVGNMLVGNNEGECCLEITLLGPEIEFLEPGVVAITGADLGANLDNRYCEPWKAFNVKKGEVFKFTGIRNGCRAYLAAAGGFKVPSVMGSKSTFLRAKIGGMDGRALQEGDELDINFPIFTNNLSCKTVPEKYRYIPRYPQIVRVILGPQVDAFTQKGINTFLNSKYMITHESDRMGCRLEGPKIEHTDKPDIISDGITAGSIQVPGNGQPIIMMADRQTTGGYAKIATVITPDLWKLAQAKPGDSIGFISVTLSQAHDAYIEYEKKLQKLPEILASGF